MTEFLLQRPIEATVLFSQFPSAVVRNRLERSLLTLTVKQGWYRPALVGDGHRGVVLTRVPKSLLRGRVSLST